MYSKVYRSRKTKHATLKSKSAPVFSVTGVTVPEETASEIDVITLDYNSESDSDVVILMAPVINSKNKRKHSSDVEEHEVNKKAKKQKKISKYRTVSLMFCLLVTVFVI